ncbi:hypothetical protein NEFER02_0482 [Nematocida sp. LUAm2]|nr:hypothetical protein NEFER02_0482 [Nematocida sp. LUAm2]
MKYFCVVCAAHIKSHSIAGWMQHVRGSLHLERKRRIFHGTQYNGVKEHLLLLLSEGRLTEEESRRILYILHENAVKNAENVPRSESVTEKPPRSIKGIRKAVYNVLFPLCVSSSPIN